MQTNVKFTATERRLRLCCLLDYAGALVLFLFSLWN